MHWLDITIVCNSACCEYQLCSFSWLVTSLHVHCRLKHTAWTPAGKKRAMHLISDHAKTLAPIQQPLWGTSMTHTWADASNAMVCIALESVQWARIIDREIISRSAPAISQSKGTRAKYVYNVLHTACTGSHATNFLGASSPSDLCCHMDIWMSLA